MFNLKTRITIIIIAAVVLPLSMTGTYVCFTQKSRMESGLSVFLEVAASSAESLDDQAVALAKTVSIFKIE